ncbi:MAG TPA: helix-turn-helix domain-containing protein [Lachnospiraceae bacterium]|nr:helix-turn-helix domain-containing protein [Lachnospiraceae bacterium]
MADTRAIDLKYLCTAIGNMSGIPVRIYQNNRLSFFHSLVTLPKDPILLHEHDILAVTDAIGYYITPAFDYYGIAHIQKNTVVIGPSGMSVKTEQELRKEAFELAVDPEKTEEFLSSMKLIVHMPLESLLQILCTVYYVMTGQKTSLTDLAILASAQKQLSRELTFETSSGMDNPHNTFRTEQQLLDIVRRGDTIALDSWSSQAPAVRPGKVAPDMLRQIKNTFIITATLVSRAAIRGGMDVDDAFRLSDSYIQKCEPLYRFDQITNLQFHMVRHYTSTVEELRYSRNQSELTASVASYIRHHLSDAIKTKDIADTLFISRSRLSTRFKAECGMNLSEYIHYQKMSEAKHLLAHSDKSLLLISTYLGYSSQSHFCRIFKKYAGMPPAEFRSRH